VSATLGFRRRELVAVNCLRRRRPSEGTQNRPGITSGGPSGTYQPLKAYGERKPSLIGIDCLMCPHAKFRPLASHGTP
jgi:hypothetical protein